MSMNFFMWAVIILLIYIAFITTIHSNTVDKQALFIAGRITDLKDEWEKEHKHINSDLSEQARNIESMSNLIHAIKDIGESSKNFNEANHRWIMANHALISSTYRLTAATDSRTHAMDIELSSTLSNYNENWTSDDSWFECNKIIREKGFDEADEFIKKAKE